jgi:hypothetical protein
MNPSFIVWRTRNRAATVSPVIVTFRPRGRAPFAALTSREATP